MQLKNTKYRIEKKEKKTSKNTEMQHKTKQ